MAFIVESQFTYSVESINRSIRRTNALLRAANAIRHSVVDIQNTIKRPTVANVMWTLIQLMRTYNALRRVYRLTVAEANKVIGATGMFKPITYIPPPPIPPPTGIGFTDTFGDLNVRVEAFRENIPMALKQLSLMNLPEQTMMRLQRVLEEDAEQTVVDAQEILTSRILHPEKSTGFLEASIGWMPELFGTRIFASAPYAWWVEEGQRTFGGHHYMQGALSLARQ